MSSEIYGFINSAALALFIALVTSALQIAGVIRLSMARLFLVGAWVVAIVGVCSSLQNAPSKHVFIAGSLTAVPVGIALVVLERWVIRKALSIQRVQLSREQIGLLDMIDKGKSTFSPGDFYPDETNLFNAVRKFQMQANELVRLQKEGYIHRILAPRESFEGQLYIDRVHIVEGLTADGLDALKTR